MTCARIFALMGQRVGRGALKMLDVKMTDQMTGREIAGHKKLKMQE